MTGDKPSVDEALDRTIRDAVAEPPGKSRGLSRETMVRRTIIVIGMLLALILVYFFLTVGTHEALDEEAEPVRESLAVRTIDLPDPDKQAREAMQGLIAPVIEAVTGVSRPELTPEEIARMEYLAYQISGPVRLETEGVAGAMSPTGGGGPHPYHGTAYGAPALQARGVAGGERTWQGYDQPSVSGITATVHPHTLWHNDTRVLEGKRMAAILETPIDTTLPGPVRAIFVEDVYSESGDRILIPKYSEALGNAGSVRIQSGQDRVGVAWHRLLLRTETGDGIVEVKLDSPAADHLGRVGIRGNVDTHFVEKFGNALLYSLIGAATSNIDAARNDEDNAQQAYLEATTGSFRATAQDSLRAQDVHDPTITVPRATPITIVAARDILFARGQVEGVR